MRKNTSSPRSFGLTVGFAFCALAALLLWRGHVLRAEVAGVTGAVLVILGLIRPALLKHPAAAWMRLAHVLGYVNSRIILTVLFALVLTPMGLLWRLVGKDPLARRRESWTGWSRYPERYRNSKHYERMY
jgi:hypothetical protein